MKIVCQRCPKHQLNGGAYGYHNWIRHLVSFQHQTEVRNLAAAPRYTWPEESNANTFVVTGIPSNVSWESKLDFVEWLSQFGLLSEFCYNPKYGFCIFTIQASGKDGLEKALSVINFKEYRGQPIFIQLKCEFGAFEWDLVFSKPDTHNDVPAQRSSQKFGKSDSRAPQGSPHIRSSVTFHNSKLPNGSSDTTNVAKNSERKSLPEVSNNQSTSKSKLSSSSSGENSPKKKSKKNKNKRGADVENEVPPPLSTSNIVPIQNQDPVPADKSKKVKSKNNTLRSDNVPEGKISSNLETTAACSRSVHENNSENNQLDFRGGFTRTRPQEQEQKVSISNDDAQRGTPSPELFKSTQEPHKLDKPETQIMENPLFKSCLSHPIVSESPSNQVILHETSPFGTPSVAHSFFENTSNLALDQIKPIAVSVKKEVPDKQTTAPDSPRKTFVAPPTGNNSGIIELQKSSSPSVSPKKQKARDKQKSDGTIIPPPKFQKFISPTFASQIPDAVRNQIYLANPQKQKSNLFKLPENSVPLSYYFDVFDNLHLPSNTLKPKIVKLCKKYVALPLERQMEEFLLALSLPQEELRLRWQVVHDILYTLRLTHPKCEVYAFGSIVTGVGDFMSDIDIFVDLNGITLPGSSSKDKLTSIQSLHLTNKTLKKAPCPHTSVRGFRRLIPITTARVPLLKLTHHPTRINCDLSFENRLSVQNTNMMKFYFNLDRRVFPLMVLIRYWGRFHELTGSNLVKNYGLMLLVLVYLVEVKIIPPITLLQKLKSDERQAQGLTSNPDEIDGWDASFCDNVATIANNFKGSPLPPSFESNSTPILTTLAMEFFEWFGNIDFSKVVVCTLLGKILPRSVFAPQNRDTLPLSLARYKIHTGVLGVHHKLTLNTPLCIQDPFVLSFNVGGVTQVKTLVRFQLACAKTYQVIKNKKDISLLDLFIPLPAHIKKKNFMKIFNHEFQADQLRSEIKLAFREINTPNPDSVAKESKTAYVILPPHLQRYGGYVDEKRFNAAYKKPRWQTYMEFILTNDYETAFLAAASEGEDVKKLAATSEWRMKMHDLWVQHAKDYLSQFFEDGLKLSVEKKHISELSEKKSPTEKRKLSQGKLIQTAEEISAASVQNGFNIKAVKAHLFYYSIIVNVNYPFWEVRKVSSNKAKNPEVVATEANSGTDQLSSTSTNTPIGVSKKKNKSPKKVEDKPIIVNPLITANAISEELLKSLSQQAKDSFESFKVKVLVKLKVSMKYKVERPRLFILFEQDPSVEDKSDNVKRAHYFISNMIFDEFHLYQLSRLHEWDKKEKLKTQS